jgi:mono/diheme cytochrome c family protein
MIAKRRGFFYRLFLFAMLTTGFFSSAFGQSLPAGAGLEIISVVCTQCHGIDYITNAAGKLTRADWENALYDMIARGAPVEEKDREVLLEYLQENLAAK